MEKCLVTKHDGISSDNNLLKVGEMRIGVPKVNNPTLGTQQMALMFTQPTTLKIIGNGRFTDSTLTQDYGKEIQSEDSRIHNGIFYISNTEYVEMSISNKYALKYLAFNYKISLGTNKFKLSLDDLKYSTALYYLFIAYGDVTGNISFLSNLTALSNLVLNNTNVTGNISSLSNLTALSRLFLSNTKITGEVSLLSNLASLNTIVTDGDMTCDMSFYANNPKLQYTSIAVKTTGDVANLKNCSELIQFNCRKDSILSGDISQLPAKCKHFNMTGEGVSGLTWSTRPSSSSIVGMILPQWAPANLDKVLQDLSACQAIQTSSDPVYYKKISLGGKRTAASDDAVATLQSKGFSVEVAK